MTATADGPLPGTTKRTDRAGTSPVAFLVLAFVWSWAAWGVALAAGGSVGEVTLVAGSFGPSLAAVVVLARAGGWPATRRALRRLVRIRGALRATCIAALVPVALAVAAVALDRALGGTTPIDLPPWWAVPLVLGYVLVLGGPLGEELGWRGLLLPELEARWGPRTATLVVGVVWTVWHLPLFLVPGSVQAAVPLWLFAAQILTTSVVYTWLVHLTPRSLVPVVVFHTSFNATVGLVLLQPMPAPATRPLLLALAMVAVLAVVLTRTGTFRGVAATPPPRPDGGTAHVDHHVAAP